MKTSALALVAIIAAPAAFAQAVPGNPELSALLNCERVEQPGGYFNFADPACPAQFRDPTPNDPVVGEGDEDAE